MSFEPRFIRQFAEFQASRTRVKSLEDWTRFSRYWFDKSDWPMKRPQQYSQEQAKKQGPVTLKGRRWSYTFYTYDISPQARYELFATLSKVGDPIRFPHLSHLPKTTPSRWTQQCPWCEISTEEIGPEVCPLCDRPLLYFFLEEE